MQATQPSGDTAPHMGAACQPERQLSDMFDCICGYNLVEILFLVVTGRLGRWSVAVQFRLIKQSPEEGVP